MLSKEEIEKAKRICRLLCGKKNKKGKREYETFTRMQMQTDYTVDQMAEAIETLLEYIEELEKSDTSKEKSSMNYYNECKELKQENNNLNKINDEMAKAMYSNISMLEMAKIGQAIDYDPRKMFAGISDEEAIGCIKQYFEKKVEKDNVKN